MKKNKKLLTLGIATTLALGLVSCSSSNNNSNNQSSVEEDVSSAVVILHEATFSEDDFILRVGEESTYLLGVADGVIIDDTVPFVIPHELSDGTKITAVGLFKYQDGTDIKTATGGPLDVIISEGITSLSNGAFYGCKNIGSVSIPSTVRTISNNSFENSTLEAVTIADGVVYVGVGAFKGCELTEVTIPNSIESIQHQAFMDNQIKDVDLGENVWIVGEYAFANNDIMNIDFPESVKSVEEGAFSGNPWESNFC